MTGDSEIAARVMRGDWFRFTPSHRFVIAANHRPLIANPDVAMRSRLRIVPFRQSFAGREDTGLAAALADEAPLVLGWLLSGAEQFFEAGRLRSCDMVEAETDAYFAAQATFDQWIEERCALDPEALGPSAELYRDFSEWKRDRGEGVPSTVRWAEQMGRRFVRVRSGGTKWEGVRLRSDLPPLGDRRRADWHD
jgi:putative DNA primase/helicase